VLYEALAKPCADDDREFAKEAMSDYAEGLAGEDTR